MDAIKTSWWGRKDLLALCVLLSLVPLLLPTIPPLVDLPGHMGRYAVQLDPAPFRDFYRFRWQFIGNLGVDLLMEPLGRLLGVELASKLIVMSIPALTVAAMIAIAREVHGEVPPTAFFAFPLAYGHPFLFGFVNFALAMALAMLAFALWLRMARLGSLKWRPYAFAVIACVVWLAHTFAWGVLGLLCFAAELYRQRDLGRNWIAAGWSAALACLPMAIPLVPMLIWRADATDTTVDWFNWYAKTLWLVMALRDRWRIFDSYSVVLLLGLIAIAIRNPWLRYSRTLGLCALILLAAFIILPRKIFGSAYADMRLMPYVIAFAVLAIRPKPEAPRIFLGHSPSQDWRFSVSALPPIRSAWSGHRRASIRRSSRSTISRTGRSRRFVRHAQLQLRMDDEPHGAHSSTRHGPQDTDFRTTNGTSRVPICCRS